MSSVVIASFIVSVLMVASQFLQTAKPLWAKLPQPLPTLLPVIVALIPQVSDILGATTDSLSLVHNLFAAAVAAVTSIMATLKGDSTSSS